MLLKKRENERHKVGETPAAGETPAPEKKPSEQVQTVTSTNPPPSSSVPTPTSGETSTASSVTKTEEKTEEIKAATAIDDKKSEETVVSDDKQSYETVVSEMPEGSNEKSADSSIAVSDSEKTVNGAKSHEVSDESSKPETSNVSTEEPEKSDS